MLTASLYVHIPFCRQRCGYCDFNTYAGLEDLIPRYMTALGCEIEQLVKASPSKIGIHTMYFGGGTPSLLSISQLEFLFDVISNNFSVDSDLEITLEANPNTIDRTYLRGIRQLGVNRLSLGMQSANPVILRLLERAHTPLQVKNSVRWARQAGFDNINLDLIFGIPSQTLTDWKKTLSSAIDLGPDHLSLYGLTIEPNTPLKTRVSLGLLETPDQDLAADMYEYAMEVLDKQQFEHYEISNWAKKTNLRSRRSRHNLQYWRNLPYIGIGAGAYGYIENIRTANVAHPLHYIQRVHSSKPLHFPQTSATDSHEIIERKAEIGETMMMGLRLLQDGVSGKVFSGRFGEDLFEYFRSQIETLSAKGLLERVGEEKDVLRLTRRGYLLGNLVFQAFI